MARLWSARTPRDADPHGVRAAAPRGVPAPLLAFLLVAGPALLMAVLVPVSDVPLYHSYGAALTRGRFPVEYPALAGTLFFLPRMMLVPYAAGFALLMGMVLVAVLAAGRRVAGRPEWTERFVCYACLGAVGVVFTRFDLLPALAVLLAVERARAGRWSAAWTWAVLGALLKVFPALLLPGFAIAEWRATGRFPWRRVGVTAAVVSAAGVVQSWYAPGSFLRPLTYELHRGFEFSSVPGTLSLLLSPAHLRFSFAYGNHQVAGPGAAAVGSLVALVAVGALVAVWALTARGRMPVEATALAVLSVAVLTDKALAPQYLLWLMPLWAYWRLRPSWLVAAALTTVVFPVVFPVLFLAVHATSLYADTVVAAVRNAVLLGGSVAWLVEGLSTHWAGPRRTVRPGGQRMEVTACSVTA